MNIALIPRRLNIFIRKMATEVSQRASVGLLIIGDEILKGRVADTNSGFMMRHLFDWGLRVERCLTIPDDVDVIATECRNFSSRFNFVITTGGIGPTNDDMTYLGIAKAFNTHLVPNNEMKEKLELYFGPLKADSPQMRLATIPASAHLVWNEQREFPIVSVENVYILPGVPSIMQKSFPRLKNVFLSQAPVPKRYSRSIFISTSEMDISKEINDVFDVHKTVQLGSYPTFENNYYKTKITLDGESEKEVEEAEMALKAKLPPDSIVDHIQNVVEILPDSVYNLLEGNFPAKDALEASLKVIEESLSKFSPESHVIAFNGGKDCTILLHLYAAVLAKNHPGCSPNVLYIENYELFPQLEIFMEESKVLYNIKKFIHVKADNIKDGLLKLKSLDASIYAIFMGTRRSDPDGKKLESFAPCDPHYGEFMRVNPILDWSYQELWSIIRTLQVPYCLLYDQGYTSLGSVEKTRKNPLLFVETRGSRDVYRPAYTLQEESNERCGRE